MTKNNPAWGKPNSPVGRVNRKEFLISSICLAGYIIILLHVIPIFFRILGRPLGSMLGFLSVGCTFYLYWKFLMLSVKRWHDMNLSGWLTLLTFIFSLIPFLMIIASLMKRLDFVIALAYINNYAESCLLALGLIQLFAKGTKGPNKYGEDPLEQKAQ